MSWSTRVTVCILYAGLALSVSGCVATRGFMTGVTGGPMIIDEIRHGEFDTKTAHTAGKSFAHMAGILTTIPVLWPLSAAYGTASGLYGAYHFWKIDKDAKAHPGRVRVRSHWRRK